MNMFNTWICMKSYPKAVWFFIFVFIPNQWKGLKQFVCICICKNNVSTSLISIYGHKGFKDSKNDFVLYNHPYLRVRVQGFKAYPIWFLTMNIRGISLVISQFVIVKLFIFGTSILLLFLLKFGVLFIFLNICAFNFQLCCYCLKVLVLIFYTFSSLVKFQSFWLRCLNVFASLA